MLETQNMSKQEEIDRLLQKEWRERRYSEDRE